MMAVNGFSLPPYDVVLIDINLAPSARTRVELSTAGSSFYKYDIWRVVNKGDTDIHAIGQKAGDSDNASATTAGVILAKEGYQWIPKKNQVAIDIFRGSDATESEQILIYPIIPSS
jgi:hypothetical protein